MSDEHTVPPESKLLKQAQSLSGIPVPELAEATGLSKATIHSAIQGVRYKTGGSILAPPSDKTLVKLARALSITPEQLREASPNRARAIHELSEEPALEKSLPSDEESQAAAAAHLRLARRVLSTFTDQELRDEIARREAERNEREASVGS